MISKSINIHRNPRRRPGRAAKHEIREREAKRHHGETGRTYTEAIQDCDTGLRYRTGKRLHDAVTQSEGAVTESFG
ncbi:hypothetical protein GCM10023100_02410 [Actinocorallia cavernae]|uniref:Uncharacterized protein n=2 Tax=Actinomycetes TaxID=1760 RepID=A0ABP5ZC23_9ACTN